MDGTAPLADVTTSGVLTLDDLPARYKGKRAQRRASRRLAVAELRESGVSRLEARRMVYAPASDAPYRQERTTRLLRRRIAAAWGIPKQKKEKR